MIYVNVNHFMMDHIDNKQLPLPKKTDSQNMLQSNLLTFLYNQVSWKYKIKKNSNDSKDVVLLIPRQNDVVAVKCSGGTTIS